jgi:hypothetical protein
LGFGDSDWVNGVASDRLIDAVYAWGTEETLRNRIQQHWDAGADHVCIQAVGGDGTVGLVDENILRMLAPSA